MPAFSEFWSSETGPPWAVVMIGTEPPAVWCSSPPAPRLSLWSWILAAPRVDFGADFFGGLGMGTPGQRDGLGDGPCVGAISAAQTPSQTGAADGRSLRHRDPATASKSAP